MEKPVNKCHLGVLTRADGSSVFSSDETSVAAGVFGPVEVKSNKALIDKAHVEAHFRPKSGLPGVKDRVNESILKSICEAALDVSLYPRTSIVVAITELQTENALMLISSAVNGVCLATLDSGIDMRCMFGAVPCFLKPDGTLSLKAVQSKAAFVFVFESTNNNIITSHTEGSFTVGQYRAALSMCRKESDMLFQLFKRTLEIK